MIDDDADSRGFLRVDTRFLELPQRETPALSDFAVVTDSLTTDSRAEKGERANAELGGLGLASITSTQLTSGLVKPGAHPALPVLAEVIAMEN